MPLEKVAWMVPDVCSPLPVGVDEVGAWLDGAAAEELGAGDEAGSGVGVGVEDGGGGGGV